MSDPVGNQTVGSHNTAHFMLRSVFSKFVFNFQDPALISNETNYEPYEAVSAVNGFIMWADGDTTVPDNSSDSTGALLGYVSN